MAPGPAVYLFWCSGVVYFIDKTAIQSCRTQFEFRRKVLLASFLISCTRPPKQYYREKWASFISWRTKNLSAICNFWKRYVLLTTTTNKVYSVNEISYTNNIFNNWLPSVSPRNGWTSMLEKCQTVHGTDLFFVIFYYYHHYYFFTPFFMDLSLRVCCNKKLRYRSHDVLMSVFILQLKLNRKRGA